MMKRKIRIQFKEDGQWKTLCIWLESDRARAEPLLEALKLAYEDARTIDYEEGTLQAVRD